MDGCFFMDSQALKIPRQRIGVLIGTQGETKKILEKKGKTRIGIDSETGEVEVETGKDAIGFLKTIEAVKAIGRGFAPEKAFKLFEDDYMLDIIELSDLGRSGKGLENVRGRIIGTQGRARQKIEEETRSLISVFGKTVAIIARVDDLPGARKAVEMLLKGASHSRVYNTLKKLETKKFELV
ncbi:MAG: RNA-processing protein [Candidatus Diapherotrites archaeon]|nr:RNA-processing protein [Candidatus Diapherotrites archaeon]